MNLQCHKDLMSHTIPSNLTVHTHIGHSSVDVGNEKKYKHKHKACHYI
jgi:hypothetical protein